MIRILYLPHGPWFFLLGRQANLLMVTDSRAHTIEDKPHFLCLRGRCALCPCAGFYIFVWAKIPYYTALLYPLNNVWVLCVIPYLYPSLPNQGAAGTHTVPRGETTNVRVTAMRSSGG